MLIKHKAPYCKRYYEEEGRKGGEGKKSTSPNWLLCRVVAGVADWTGSNEQTNLWFGSVSLSSLLCFSLLGRRAFSQRRKWHSPTKLGKVVVGLVVTFFQIPSTCIPLVVAFNNQTQNSLTKTPSFELYSPLKEDRRGPHTKWKPLPES